MAFLATPVVLSSFQCRTILLGILFWSLPIAGSVLFEWRRPLFWCLVITFALDYLDYLLSAIIYHQHTAALA